MVEVILNPKSWLAGGILLASVVTDLRSKKVPNRLVLVGLGIALLSILLLDGRSGLWPAASSFATAIVFALPLYLLRALGGGDFKLLMIISLFLPWDGVVVMIFSALVWGALLGLIRVILDGKLNEFFFNLFSILKRTRPSDTQLTKVPFTVAIFFGFLTQLVLSASGVSWL